MILRRAYPSVEIADRIRRALEPDAPPNLTSRVEENVLILELTAPSAASARATMEDLLPCVSTAERAQGIIPVPVTESDADE
jgi:hypothetical protein